MSDTIYQINRDNQFTARKTVVAYLGYPLIYRVKKAIALCPHIPAVIREIAHDV